MEKFDIKLCIIKMSNMHRTRMTIQQRLQANKNEAYLALQKIQEVESIPHGIDVNVNIPSASDTA